MTTLLTGISVALGALVVLLLALLVVRWRSDAKTDERVAEVVHGLNARMDELGRELAGALERAEEEGRRSRIFGELTGSIDLDEVLSRALEAAGALEGADAALVMLPDAQGGKPLVATLGLSVEEAERHAITGPPDGRLARSITMAYTYPELQRQGEAGGAEIIHSGLAVPLPGEQDTLGYLTVFTRSQAHHFSDDDVRQLETLALRAGPAIENARRFREARQLADLDALTGLHNRRFFHETLARECARAHRYERKLALIVFDLDDFKDVNDRIGTWPAMRRSRRQQSACVTSCGRRTSPVASAETSSRSSSPSRRWRTQTSSIGGSWAPCRPGRSDKPGSCTSRRALRSFARKTTRCRSSSVRTTPCTAQRKPAKAASSRRTHHVSARPEQPAVDQKLHSRHT